MGSKKKSPAPGNKASATDKAERQRTALLAHRDGIDTIDNTILSLLHKRLEHAKAIGKIKDSANRAKWDPRREREIFQRLTKTNNNIFPEPALLNIFHEIITTCRLSQKPVEVAYLGPEATFTHQAGVKYFGRTASYQPIETIEEVFIEVERGRTQYGIVPVENSIEGSVTSTLDSFMKTKVKICSEVQLGITHNLLNQTGDMDDVKRVVSHSQPLAQCRQWLRKHLPGIPCDTVFSTGLAAQMAAEDRDIAAIASTLAIKTYHLQPVVKGIEDYSGNTTRFLLIGKESPQRSGKDKTSLLVGLLDRAGALNDTLSILAQRQINLTKIESRPVKGEPGKYLFFIDMLGHMDDEHIKEGCDRLREVCSYFEWLGSYPQQG